MLIIEGPDGVGKSTLQAALLKQWNENARKYGSWPAIPMHLGRPPASWHHYKSYLPHVTRGAVWDRFHLSELCYGLVCRGGGQISPAMLRLLEARLALAGSVTVVVTASDGRIIKEHRRQTAAGKRELFTEEQVIAVNAAYRDQLVTGDRADWREARVDFHLHLGETGWPSDDEEWMDKVLAEWSQRLAQLYSIEINGQSFYGPPSAECI